MKYIQKGGEPAQLRKWRLENKSTPQNLRYANIPKNALEQVRLALLKEQGYLCAYTMLRIAEPRKGHIEHIVAQSRDEGFQIRFSNMVYCHPGEGEPRCLFGAHAKDGQQIGLDNFVSPLDKTCESRFAYLKYGDVAATRDEDIAAQRTVEILNLNSPDLQRARRAAIQTLPIFKSSGSPISARQAKKGATILRARDSKGRFPEFAVALAQVIAKYAKQKAAREAAIGAR